MLPEIGFHSADDHGSVGVPDFLEDESNRVGALLAQRPGKKIGTILQILRRCSDPLPCVFWDRARGRRIIQNRRDRAGRKTYALRHRFQCHYSRVADVRLFGFPHSG